MAHRHSHHDGGFLMLDALAAHSGLRGVSPGLKTACSVGALLLCVGAAEELISQVDPDYEPWAESLIELPGGETESLLFCLQAALGAAVIGFGFGYLVARKKDRAEEAA